MPEETAPAEAGTATQVDTQPAPEVKPEVDWKAKAREWEKRAKENSTAAQRLAELEEAQKTNEQRLADRVAQVERERDETRVELTRFRLATRYGLAEDDLDFLGSGTDEEMEDRAKRLSERIAASDPEMDNRPRMPAPDPSQGRRISNDGALNGDPILDTLRNKLGIR